MIKINLHHPLHNFEKINLVTKSSSKGGYDEYQCTLCGLKGKLYGFEGILILSGNLETKRMKNCIYSDKKIKEIQSTLEGKVIQIIECTALGKVFTNLLPKSKHRIIKPPEKYVNDSSGVWVMGVGEPVKVLSSEYVISKMIRTKHKN